MHRVRQASAGRRKHIPLPQSHYSQVQRKNQFPPALTRLHLNDALNYRTVTKNIIQHVENNRFSLLEKLTQDVLDIAREHHWVTYAEVEIDKLHALRYADSVSMTLSWQR
ncbi:FolB domain-containing protein [Escherichia coli]